MKRITDAMQSTLIGIIARVPVPDARKLLLTKVEAALDLHTGKLTDEAFGDIIRDALASFRPGTWHGDAQGLIPPITASTSLKEASEIYMRALREVGMWYWPPLRPMTEEEKKKKATEEECGDYKRELKYPVEGWHEPVASKPITQDMLIEADPPPVTMPASLVDRVEAVSLERHEYVVEERRDAEPRESEMKKAARLARKRAGGLSNRIKVYFR